jgi:hypothetical protein
LGAELGQHSQTSQKFVLDLLTEGQFADLATEIRTKKND